MKFTTKDKAGTMRGSRLRLFSLSALALASTAALPAHAQDTSDEVKAQISEILGVKDTFTPEEQKMSSTLVFARRKALGQYIGQAADALTPAKGASELARVEVRGVVKNRLRNYVSGTLGGQVTSFAKTKTENKGVIVADVPLDSLTLLAANADVASVRVVVPRYNNIGSLNTQGIISHQAKTVYKGAAGYKGAGVKVGVISDSASQAQINKLIASADLNPDAKSLVPYVGAGGTDFFTDEGAAIMEIVQDMAPAATVEFASGFGDFAGAVIALRNDGCKVIIDDLGGPEGVFQDDTVALAVNSVTATGTVYVSSAANSGNLAHGTSGCWEGDFNPAGGTFTVPTTGITGPTTAKSYVAHAFAAGQAYNTFTSTGEPYQFVTWADSLNNSTNDYDLFVTDSTGTTLKGFSVDTQSAASPGYAAELVGTAAAAGGNYNTQTAGDRFVITHVVGAADLAMHFDVERGTLGVNTNGATYGHNAGLNTVSVAASYWNSARTGTKAFNGTSNPCETFSSDGPRKMFFNPDGTPITPGKFTFASAGGVTLNKPDVTGADGVSTTTINSAEAFLPFFGTSAAAPHIAGIAAEIISARAQNNKATLTPAQIQQSLIKGALDNEAAGFDPTGGYGTVSAPAAVAAALALP